MMVDFKQKFQNQWEHSNKREHIARLWLQLFGIEAKPCGFGTLYPDPLQGYHRNPMEKFDFYVPELKLYFEVTGTYWKKHESAKRFKKPLLPILKAKVDAAFYYGLSKRVWFIAVCDCQGEVRLFPCNRAPQYPLGHYAKGEGEYYMIPWDDWLTPLQAMNRILGRVWEGY